jgi:hypothetical protein
MLHAARRGGVRDDRLRGVAARARCASCRIHHVRGLAATIHGAARATYDVDVVYARTPENLSRIVAALAPLRPYLRGAPAGLPFTWDIETLSKGLNFTLTTTAGDLDRHLRRNVQRVVRRYRGRCRARDGMSMPFARAVDPGEARSGARQGSGGARRVGSHRRGTPPLTTGAQPMRQMGENAVMCGALCRAEFASTDPARIR